MKINPLLILFLFIFNLFSFSQEIIIDVKQVQGVSYISGNTSPIAAKEQALNEAKLNALRKANISEEIISNETFLTSESDGNFQDFYSSDFYSNFKGAIKSFEITSDRMIAVELGIKRVITINAKVIKYKTVEDSNFIIDIDGIKGSYNAGKFLEFKVVSSKKCYLTIFWIDESGSDVLFPNDDEDYFSLIPNENYIFADGDDSNELNSYIDSLNFNSLKYFHAQDLTINHFFTKISQALDMVETKYSMFVEFDDFIFPKSISAIRSPL